MRIVQKEVLKKYKELALKHNVPVQTIIDIESSIWKYVGKEMSSGIKEDFNTFKNIYLKNLGTFYAHKGKHTNMNKHNKDA